MSLAPNIPAPGRGATERDLPGGGLTRRLLRSRAVAALASPHPVDRYLEVVDPMWAVDEVRARVVDVRTEVEGPAPVTTLTLRPTSTWQGFRAGQFVQVGVEIDGARRTRCFSISSSEADGRDTFTRDELERLGRRENVDLVLVHTQDGGARFTADELARLVPDHRDVATFACGPAGLVRGIQEAYGDSDRLQVEYFKTSTLRVDPGDAEGSVSFSVAGRAAENTGETLLEQAEALGLTPQYGCRMGICFSCTARKTEGTVRNVVTGATSGHPVEDIQLCVSQPVGSCTVAL